MLPKKINIIGIFDILIVLVLVSAMLDRLWETVETGETVVIQGPSEGDIRVCTKPGIVWQGFGRATHYKNSNHFWFPSPDNSLAVRGNDGGLWHITGSASYDLPTGASSMARLHSTFGSQEAIDQAIMATIEAEIYAKGTEAIRLMGRPEALRESHGITPRVSINTVSRLPIIESTQETTTRESQGRRPLTRSKSHDLVFIHTKVK